MFSFSVVEVATVQSAGAHIGRTEAATRGFCKKKLFLKILQYS